MERINLIPDDLSLTWRDRLLSLVDRHFIPALVWMVLAVGATEGLASINLNMKTHRYIQQVTRLTSKRGTLKAELENAKAYLAQLDKAEQELKQQMQWLIQRIAYLSVYRETPGEWAATLQDVKRAIPYGVWLTELESGADGAQLRIAGGAFDDKLVTQFMGQLKENPRFSNVAFSFARKANIGKTGIVAFEVTCQVMAARSAVGR